MRALDGFLLRLYRLSGLAFPYRLYATALKAAPPAAGAAAAAAAAVWVSPTASLVAGLTAAAAAAAALLLYPLHLVAARRAHFEANLVYTLASLIPMLAAGIPLSRALARLTEVEEDRYIARELALVVADVSTGLEPVEALRRSAERVPSGTYREVVRLIEGSMRTTGRPDVALMARLEWMLRSRQAQAASTVRAVSLLLEAYVVVALLLPMLLYVVAAALSPLGPLSVGPLSIPPADLMVLGAALGLLAGAAMYLLVDMAVGV